MGPQYAIVVPWDTSLMDVTFTNTFGGSPVKGLVSRAMKITTGPPATTAGFFIPGAIVQNAITGVIYSNTGSTASPVWSVLDAGAGFTLPATITDSTTTTGTSFALVMSALTTGVAEKVTSAAMTTGAIFEAIATAATLTTGRYYKANDGALDVWGIGANGHMHTAQTTAPTIVVTTANGITAAAITAGSSDTCGTITTTGTNNAGGATVLDVTFNKTYTTAPKSIQLQALNTSASKAAATSLFTAIVSAKSATGFTIMIPSDASAGATPSWSYQVIG